jgi:hypothetical protein
MVRDAELHVKVNDATGRSQRQIVIIPDGNVSDWEANSEDEDESMDVLLQRVQASRLRAYEASPDRNQNVSCDSVVQINEFQEPTDEGLKRAARKRSRGRPKKRKPPIPARKDRRGRPPNPRPAVSLVQHATEEQYTGEHQAEATAFTYKWRKIDLKVSENERTDVQAPAFTRPCEILTPVTYFKRFFDDELFEHIVCETNKYAVQQTGNSINLCKAELEQFIGCLLYMSIVSLPTYRMYWADETRVEQIYSLFTIYSDL